MALLSYIHPQEEEKLKLEHDRDSTFPGKILSLDTTCLWVGGSWSSPMEGGVGTLTKPQAHALDPTSRNFSKLSHVQKDKSMRPATVSLSSKGLETIYPQRLGK